MTCRNCGQPVANGPRDLVHAATRRIICNSGRAVAQPQRRVFPAKDYTYA